MLFFRLTSKILHHGLGTLFHCLTLCWTYVLMLAAMTMNPAIFLSSILGCSFGYYICHQNPIPRTQEISKAAKGQKQTFNSNLVKLE